MRLVLGILPLLWFGAAAAQSPADRKPGAQAAPDEALRNDVRERLKMMKIWKITELLSLDVPTSEKFFPLLARFEARLSPLQRQQAALVRSLRAELESKNPDSAALNRMIDELGANKRQIAAIEEERGRELRRVLTPAQIAKLILELPRIDREVTDYVRRAMNLPAGDAPPTPRRR